MNVAKRYAIRIKQSVLISVKLLSVLSGHICWRMENAHILDVL